MMEKFEVIFKEYYSRLVFYAKSKVLDMEVAEDVVQDAFVQLINNKTNISEDTSPIAVRNFLYTSIRYTILNRIRRTKVHDTYLLLTPREELDDTDLEQDIIKVETYFELYKAIDSLPHVCQKVVRYGYLEELSNSEIADKLGITVETVKSHKKRGVKLLLQRMTTLFFLFFFTPFM
ncbi:sigma-70 family RNA polymerase sigma factor [Sphingobacterium paucimobilis]|uniref:HTH luxR-type domain-containing protein n=1 Tax=Sphingobacterium paucimobilis HER1398 TaxID=1346330 RepID=U2HV89_9SPHI|nr:sigma-70 family RNA polymerase sigma factor [Sphingobacterium paucimobilis]ERJ59190.1 hypothetical protein M472_10440 [Sphingobacterium paucimobilis HER1398]